jgi:DNA-binding CsgD family transcriptional regulator/PAS domain-containing protein
MGLAGDDDLLDLIYEAAVQPDLWRPVLERFADRVGGTSAWLSRLDLADARGAGIIARIDPAMTSLYLNHYASVNPLAHVSDPVAYKQSWSLRILTDEDWMPKDELTAGEYYNDFLRPQNIHSTMMIRLALQGDEVSALNVNRSSAQGQFGAAELEEARRLHPHLIRAFRVSGALAELTLDNSDLSEALERSHHGVLVLGANGRIRQANAAARSLFSDGFGLCVREGRLAAGPGEADRRLSSLIARAAQPNWADRIGGSMVLAIPGRARPLKIAVSPLSPDRLAMFGGKPGVLVMVTDADVGASPTRDGLRERFGFTAAETRVALGLLDGAKPQQLADRLGVSVHTVRNQLRSLFDKTGVTCRSELVVALLRPVAPN